MMSHRILFLIFICVTPVFPQAGDHQLEEFDPDSSEALPLPILIPLSTYVTCGPAEGGTEIKPAPITVAEAMKLQVRMLRDQLPKDCGVQFLSVVISTFDKRGNLRSTVTKYAFTYPEPESGDSDRTALIHYSKQIVPFGYVSEKKLRRVMILNDTVPEWSVIKIEVTPDNEYTKFADRYQYKMEWWYRVTGSRFEYEFYLGIPKVLYDSRRDDTITYGNASAMLRFYLLHGKTGERFPFNIGIGTFGVSTPIDVSKNGGGIAVSLMFDIIQAVRTTFDLNITNKVNAGIELTPFFPIERRSRLLVNARIGYSP